MGKNPRYLGLRRHNDVFSLPLKKFTQVLAFSLQLTNTQQYKRLRIHRRMVQYEL